MSDHRRRVKPGTAGRNGRPAASPAPSKPPPAPAPCPEGPPPELLAALAEALDFPGLKCKPCRPLWEQAFEVLKDRQAQLAVQARELAQLRDQVGRLAPVLLERDTLAAENQRLRAQVGRLSRRQKRRGPDYPAKAQQVRELAAAGESAAAIARQLRISRRTVGRYLRGA